MGKLKKKAKREALEAKLEAQDAREDFERKMASVKKAGIIEGEKKKERKRNQKTR